MNLFFEYQVTKRWQEYGLLLIVVASIGAGIYVGNPLYALRIMFQSFGIVAISNWLGYKFGQRNIDV